MHFRDEWQGGGEGRPPPHPVTGIYTLYLKLDSPVNAFTASSILYFELMNTTWWCALCTGQWTVIVKAWLHTEMESIYMERKQLTLNY